MATALTQKVSLAPAVTAAPVPLLPTLVVASYKGGVWKTSLAVALAERLALAELKVLLITSDTQEDARARLGIQASDPQVARVSRGGGSITVVGAHGTVAAEIIYRSGPKRFLGDALVDVVVVDTPPTLEGGLLPSVTMITPVDGTDAIRNATAMLLRTPTTTQIVLVKVGARVAPSDWAEIAMAIEKATKKNVNYLHRSLPKSKLIFEAHCAGNSVWSLPRRGCALEFLEGVDILASFFWNKHFPKKPWPEMPSPKAASFIAGWDENDEG